MHFLQEETMPGIATPSQAITGPELLSRAVFIPELINLQSSTFAIPTASYARLYAGQASRGECSGCKEKAKAR